MTEPVAASIFRLCVLYLLDAGWYRDGEDLGIWIGPGRLHGSWSFGEALTLQLEADHVSMLDAVAGA